MRTTVLLICVVVGLSACGDDGGGSDGHSPGGDGTGAGMVGTDGHGDGVGAVGTYEDVTAILGGPEIETFGKCAAMSCHGGGQAGKAELNFKSVTTDVTEVLVNVPACENNAMMRVAPGDPDNSWLWVKLTADVVDEIDGVLIFEGEPSPCLGVSNGFGTRMPQQAGFYQKLPQENLDTIRTWIEAGAPGPSQ